MLLQVLFSVRSERRLLEQVRQRAQELVGSVARFQLPA